MKLACRLAVVMSLFGGLCGGIASAQEAEKAGPATRPAAPTVGARCNLRITWNSQVPHVQYEEFILQQPATKEAAKALLNLDDLRLVMSIGRFTLSGPGSDAGITLYVGGLVDMPGARPAAAEFVGAIIAELPKQLSAYQQSYVSRELEIVRERMLRAATALDRDRAERADRLRQLRELTGRSDAAANWADAIATMEQERQKLTLDLAGQKARRRAIERTIATTTKEAEERAKDDPIAAELAKIVDLRMVEAQRMRQLVQTGRAGESELADIEAKVADAKARLLERRELAARAAGGELLGELNRELLMLSIDAAESEARLELIQKTLSGFVEAADDVDRLNLLEKDLARAEAAFLNAKKEVASVEESYRNLPDPKITVLDCEYATPEQARNRQWSSPRREF